MYSVLVIVLAYVFLGVKLYLHMCIIWKDVSKLKRKKQTADVNIMMMCNYVTFELNMYTSRIEILQLFVLNW